MMYGGNIVANTYAYSNDPKPYSTICNHMKKYVIKTDESAIEIPIKKVLVGDDIRFLVRTISNETLLISPRVMINMINIS